MASPRYLWLALAGFMLVVTSFHPVFLAEAQDTDAEETISALETQIATLENQDQEEPTEDSESSADSLLYEADWSDGLGEWSVRPGSTHWKTVSGMLVSDGSNHEPREYVSAPSELESLSDYVLEAEIQWLQIGSTGGASSCEPGFGFVTRADSFSGYWTGLHFTGSWSLFGGEYSVHARTSIPADDTCSGFEVPILEQDFLLDTDWHLYRLEVQGNVTRLFIDDTLILESVDNLYLSPGRIGLYTVDTQVSVRTFRVYSL